MKGCDFLDKQTLAELSAEIQEGTESARAALESMRHALEPSGGDGRAEAQLSAGDLTKLVRELMAAHRAVCEVNQTLARLLAAQQGATHVVPTARSVEQRETRATRRARAGVATAGEAEPTRAGGVERLRGELRELRMELDRMPATPQRADWEQRWAALNRQLEQEPVDEETLRREIQLLRSVVFSTLWAERLPVGSAVLKSPRELRTLPSRPRTVKVASRRIPRRLAMAMAVAGVLTLGGVAVALRLVQPHGVSEAAISREDAGVSDS
ncbi:MAG: hypothetical protein NZ483_07805, partial [Verrucomicrobiae bacterium]|nr:hypothetical protein [Verrucomicrobiae bacterium]